MSWFNNLQLRWKLLCAFGVTLVIMTGAAGFGVYRLVQATQSYNRLVETLYTARSDVTSTNTLFITRHKILNDIYLFDTDPVKVQSTVDQMADLDEQVTANLARLRANPALLPEELKDVDDAGKSYSAYQAASKTAVDTARGIGDPYALQQAAAALTSGTDKPVSAALDDLSTRITQRTADEVARTEGEVRTLLPIVIGLLGFSIVVSVVVAVTFERSMAVPLAIIRDGGDHFAHGDVKFDIGAARRRKTQRNDEIGKVADSFRTIGGYLRQATEYAEAIARGDLSVDVQPQSEKDLLGVALKEMVSNLRSLVGAVQHSAQALASTSADLSSAAAQTGSAVQQVTMAAQNVAAGAQETSRSAQESTAAVGQLAQVIDGIARGATDQARQVHTTSATATQMAAGIEEVATKATEMASASQQTRTAAEHGGRAVRETTAAMNEIQAVVGQAAGRVQPPNRSRPVPSR